MATNTHQYEADGDVVMKSVGQPVFEFIQAPQLADWSHSALVKWKQARDQYEETIRQRCLESKERPEGAMKPVKATIDRKLLEVVCLYELRKAVDDVGNEEIVLLIKQRIGTVKNEQIPDLDELFKKKLKINLTEDDIDARVLKYYQDFSTIIENQGLGKILGVGDPDAAGFADRMKLRCTILIDNLEPRMVRDDVKRHCKYECREAKRNDFMLFNIIKEKARAQHKYHLMAMEQKPKSAPIRKNGSVEMKSKPGATSEDKTRAVDKMKEVKDRSRTKTVRVTPQPGEVLVNELVVLPYCADSGSDLTIIPHAAVEELVALGEKVDVQVLPRALEATVAGGATVTCYDSVIVDIVLQTAAGTVKLREVNCMIMEGNETEFLLGNDTLVSLGIDVNQQLEQLAGCALPEDVDPFEMDERVDLDLSTSEVRDKLEDMVVAAGNNGFDPDYLSFLREVVLDHEDIFRIDLGADPPADIAPLRIQLVEGATPFRARSRRYAQAQRNFLRQYTKRLELMGFIRQNNQSHWACAAVPVAKPKSQDEFRMTIDYRPVNALTVPIAGAVQDIADSADETQEFMSFVTTDTVWTPSRVPQGASDSATHFQNEMQLVFADMLYVHLLVWIDDILVYAKDASTFIAALRQFFGLVRAHRLKLSVSKSCLFQKEIRCELGWGLVVTQVDNWDAELPAPEQPHQLLICKSGIFDDTERRWSIIEKEAYPIIWAARNLGHLLIRPSGFRLFCDHKNLIFVFAPNHEVKRHIRGKLQRWALSLTGLIYQIDHIDGSANVWADLLSRWGLAHPSEVGLHVKCKFVTRSQQRLDDEVNLQMDELRPRQGDFVFPTLEEIKGQQLKHK
ncbi:hypothetical protein PHMEG_00020277, partial [Phytophthora megakarya]